VAEVTGSLDAARAEHQQARARELAKLEAVRQVTAKARKQDRKGGGQSQRSEHRDEGPYKASFEERGIGLANHVVSPSAGDGTDE
jgi:hypothetical protein